MKGKVAFYYTLDYGRGQGKVRFQLFGQQCNACMPGNFQHAMWYPQEVIRVSENILVFCLFLFSLELFCFFVFLELGWTEIIFLELFSGLIRLKLLELTH